MVLGKNLIAHLAAVHSPAPTNHCVLETGQYVICKV
jgi:hypothetical protein